MIKGLNIIVCQVTRMDVVVAFYRDVCELALRFSSASWSEFDLGSGVRLGLHPPFEGEGAASSPPTRGWLVCFEVEDIERFRRRLEAKGTAVSAYHEVPKGCIFDFHDPDGNPLQALQSGVTLRELQAGSAESARASTTGARRSQQG